MIGHLLGYWNVDIAKLNKELMIGDYRMPWQIEAEEASKKCPIVQMVKQKEDEKFAYEYLREYAHSNNKTLEQSAVEITQMKNLDLSIKIIIMNIMMDKSK